MYNRNFFLENYCRIVGRLSEKIPKIKDVSSFLYVSKIDILFGQTKNRFCYKVGLTILSIFCILECISGQSSINTAGTTGNGSGGAFSSSLGQLDYTTLTGAGGTATLGVQQVYDPACQVSATISGQTSLCTGTTAILTASGGTAYMWNTGATTNTLSTTASGMYTVSVTDADNCTATATATVTFSDCTIPTVVSIVQPGCSGAATGSVVLGNLPAGNWYIEQTGTIVQSYTGTGTTYTITGLAPGVYRFRVRNASGAYSGLTPPFAVIIVKC